MGKAFPSGNWNFLFQFRSAAIEDVYMYLTVGDTFSKKIDHPAETIIIVEDKTSRPTLTLSSQLFLSWKYLKQ